VRMSGGQPSYSHVVTVSGTGKIVYTAGQLARDIDGNCVGKGDMRAQWNRTFKNLDNASRRPVRLGRRREDQYLRHRFRRIPEVWRCTHALSWCGHPNQHDRRRNPPRRSDFMIEIEAVAVVNS